MATTKSRMGRRLTSTITTLVLLAGSCVTSVALAADSNDDDARVTRGLEIAPVPLNLGGKSRELVGLGSYLVNVVAGCNDCHSAGPQVTYAPGGNPYFKGNQPTVVNQSTYLGGGRNFGSLIPGTPEIVSRNLTPDRTGRPAGGLTFAQFRHILRSGEDRDHLHPNCSSTVTTNCFPAPQPFNGDLLQVMPWPCIRVFTTAICVRSMSTCVQSRAFKDPLVACCTTIAPDSHGSANNRSAFEATRRIRQFGPWRY